MSRIQDLAYTRDCFWPLNLRRTKLSWNFKTGKIGTKKKKEKRRVLLAKRLTRGEIQTRWQSGGEQGPCPSAERVLLWQRCLEFNLEGAISSRGAVDSPRRAESQGSATHTSLGSLSPPSLPLPFPILFLRFAHTLLLTAPSDNKL